MPGSVKILDTVSAIAADTDNQTLATPGGAHTNATFYADVTIGAGGGDWSIALFWSPDGTRTGGVQVGAMSTQTASGFYEIALSAPFTTEGVAIPEPNLAFYNEGTDGSTLTATIYAFYGD